MGCSANGVRCSRVSEMALENPTSLNALAAIAAPPPPPPAPSSTSSESSKSSVPEEEGAAASSSDDEAWEEQDEDHDEEEEYVDEDEEYEDSKETQALKKKQLKEAVLERIGKLERAVKKRGVAALGKGMGRVLAALGPKDRATAYYQLGKKMGRKRIVELGKYRRRLRVRNVICFAAGAAGADDPATARPGLCPEPSEVVLAESPGAGGRTATATPGTPGVASTTTAAQTPPPAQRPAGGGAHATGPPELGPPPTDGDEAQLRSLVDGLVEEGWRGIVQHVVHNHKSGEIKRAPPRPSSPHHLFHRVLSVGDVEARLLGDLKVAASSLAYDMFMLTDMSKQNYNDMAAKFNAKASTLVGRPVKVLPEHDKFKESIQEHSKETKSKICIFNSQGKT